MSTGLMLLCGSHFTSCTTVPPLVQILHVPHSVSGSLVVDPEQGVQLVQIFWGVTGKAS